MCNLALSRELYGRVPLPPATETIGTDYFLLHVAQHAALPGVLHNRHIVNFHTGERRTDSGRLAYHLRLAKFLLLSGRLGDLYTAMPRPDRPCSPSPDGWPPWSRDGGRPRPDDPRRLATVEHAYRRLGPAWTPVADALAAHRPGSCTAPAPTWRTSRPSWTPGPPCWKRRGAPR
ncbi:DUF6271 family protein [Kitasatospora fiedleri]|uniref:DUF6271 family protein n=1 Tax=Kitasatospora fiedleri TaxID=2991545 RepID=UPI00249CB479|nr:DUF6271 family protein [Kitasatospora fiedleri]